MAAGPSNTANLADLRRYQSAALTLTDLARDCALLFREYEAHHLAKDPPDAEKAKRNADMAARCESCLPVELLGADGRVLTKES